MAGKVDGLIASVFIREKGCMPYTTQPGLAVSLFLGMLSLSEWGSQ